MAVVDPAETESTRVPVGEESSTADESKKAKKGKRSKSGDKRKAEELSELAREFGAQPGVARHGEIAMRWTPEDDCAFRDDVDDDDDDDERYIGTLSGHFAVFNRFTEINSFFEGRFMEQIAPGACKKTFTENRNGMRCLMQHGRDPVVGMKPLGPIRELEEDDFGARYEVPLLDTSYNRDLLPALKETPSLYGASFRFQVIREEVNAEPGRSEHNPDGIEERTIVEMKVREFGPVTFPAYEDATASARSLNDWWLDLDLELFARAHPGAYPARLAELLLKLRSEEESQPKSTETRTETTTQERETAAPPSRAPDASLRSTRLTGAARTPLKIGQNKEPSWKL